MRCRTDPVAGMALFATVCCLAAPSRLASQEIFHVYYGSLHNHCEISDGTGTAGEAYQTAKYEAGLDFFSLSDHAEFMSSSEWQILKDAADTYDEPGRFTAFWGFEWSSVIYGHLTVTASEDYASSLDAGTDTFREIHRWLNDCQCAAFLNHPGDYNGLGLEFNHFDINPSSNLVGMELWNGTSGFDRYYLNEGYHAGDGGLGFFDEALIRGWRIGAAGACDIHGGNWGSGLFRLAVLSGNLDRQSLMEAFIARRFYSTLDMNLEMSFRINGEEMGSILEPGQYQAEVRLHDADLEVFAQMDLVRKGQVVGTYPLSETDPVLSFEVEAGPSDYYYVVVTQEDGDQAISSPFFFHTSGLPTGGTEPSLTSPGEWTVTYGSGGKLTVCLPSQERDIRICLADISGRIVYEHVPGTESCVDIPVTGLLPGIYLLFDPGHPWAGHHKVMVW